MRQNQAAASDLPMNPQFAANRMPVYTRNPISWKCLKANNSSGELKVASCSISQKSGITPKQPSASNSCNHFHGAKKTSNSNECFPKIAHHCLNEIYLHLSHRNQLRVEKRPVMRPVCLSCHRRSITLPHAVNGQLRTVNHLSGLIIHHAYWRQPNAPQPQLFHLSD